MTRQSTKRKSKNTATTSGLTDLRQIQYWLTHNSVRGNCWIVLNQIDDMLAHTDATFLDAHRNPISDRSKMTLSSKTLRYVYSAYLTTSSLITLVQGADGVYIIKNTKMENTKTENTKTENTDVKKAEPDVV